MHDVQSEKPIENDAQAVDASGAISSALQRHQQVLPSTPRPGLPDYTLTNALHEFATADESNRYQAACKLKGLLEQTDFKLQQMQMHAEHRLLNLVLAFLGSIEPVPVAEENDA